VQDVEEVQVGVIKNLAVFLRLLPEPCRVSYLPVLHDILHSTNPFNWRLRRALAIQLPALIDLPPKSDLCTMLFPLVMTLLQDPVADVRKDSFKGVAKLVLVLYEHSKSEISHPFIDVNFPIQGRSSLFGDSSPMNSQQSLAEIAKQATHDLETVIRGINILIRGETYQIRQLWLELCHRLLRDLPRELFEESFIDGILKLTCDHVSNVRVAVAIVIAGWGPDDLAPWEELDVNTTTPSVEGEEPESSMSLESISVSLNDLDSQTKPVVTQKSRTETKMRQSPWKWLLERSDIRECVRRLSKDDYDVYYNVVKLQPLFPEITFEKMSCRGMKSPPGGTEPIRRYQASTEHRISLEVQDDDMSLLLSPGHGGLDLSNSTCAHINYAAASPRVNGQVNRFTTIPSGDVDDINTMESLEGFEEFMNTMDMGPMHP